jgi:2-methylisocitrate lyase-like PEP mutase family enzyme
MTDQPSKTERFRSLHVAGSPLVLVTAWDAASARIIEEAGALAVATTSAGAAWSLGVPDGEVLGREQAVAVAALVAAAVSVPVTVDIESGYGRAPEDVGDTVAGVLAAGAVGVNIEDARHDGVEALRNLDDQCARLAAARTAADRAGIALYINARIDTYLRRVGGVAETAERAAAYLAAGVDGIFVPGVADPGVIAQLVAAIPAPLNIMVGPGAPTVPELAKVGVARVSLGRSVARAAYSITHRAAVEAFGAGTYTALADATNALDIDGLLRAT